MELVEKAKLGDYEDKIDEYTNPERKLMKIVVNSGEDGKVVLPIPQNEENDYTIDWGDGTVAKVNEKEEVELQKVAALDSIKLAEVTVDEKASHQYVETNTEYTVTIAGIDCAC